MPKAKMRKRRTSWMWGVADSNYAGDLAATIMFHTREEARAMATLGNDGQKGSRRFYPVRLEVSWDIREKDRW